MLPVHPTSRSEAMPSDIIAWSKGEGPVSTRIRANRGLTRRQQLLASVHQATTRSVTGIGSAQSLQGRAKVTAGMVCAPAEAVAGQVDCTAPERRASHRDDSHVLLGQQQRFAVLEDGHQRGPSRPEIKKPVQAVHDAMGKTVYEDGAA